MSGAKTHLTTLTVFEMEHDSFPRGVALPATAALPEFCRLKLRQQGFKRPSGIHFLLHDCADLAQHAPHQGQVGVNPRTDATDVSPAQQQLVGCNFRVSGHIPQRHQHQAGDAHGRERQGSGKLSPLVFYQKFQAISEVSLSSFIKAAT